MTPIRPVVENLSELSADEADDRKTMHIVAQVMVDYRETFIALAKSEEADRA